MLHTEIRKFGSLLSVCALRMAKDVCVNVCAQVHRWRQT